MIDYPKGISENWAHRGRLWHEAEQDPQFRAALKVQCANDILFWFNSFCFVHEPKPAKQQAHKASDAKLPFITYDFQDDYIMKVVDHINTGKDLLTEKSRDMGASWMVLAVFVWFWQFGGAGNDFLIGSRTQDYVDKSADMDALFPKARYLLANQPKWLLPEGFDIKKHSPFLMLVNPKTGSTISGEANNAYFGSGGRRKSVLLDELAKWKHTDENAWESLGDVTDCRLAVASANGKNNHFYKLRSGEYGDIEKARLHWKLHPHKDATWYAKEKTRRGKAELAKEVDIDYAASVSNKAYESYDESIHVKPVERDLYMPLTLMCDFNINPMSWAVAQEHGGYCDFIGELSIKEVSTARAAEKFAAKYRDHENKQILIYGDASGHARQRAVKGLPTEYAVLTKVLHSKGWDVTILVPRAQPLVSPSIEALDKRFCDWENSGKSWITIDPSCTALIESLEQTQRKDDGIDKDGSEHMTDGPRYWASKKYPIIERTVTHTSSW